MDERERSGDGGAIGAEGPVGAPIPPGGASAASGGTADAPAAPVAAGARIGSLDTLRGVALLGILTMNIGSFAISGYVFFEPPIAGGFEGLDFAAWLAGYLLFEQKMMAIFTLLFGAGIVLFAERASRGRRWVFPLHARRMAWLFVFGMLHAYLLWEGDILVSYAICGMLAYPLWRLRARWLVAASLALLIVTPMVTTAQGIFFGYTRSAAEERAALIERGEEVPQLVDEMATVWIGEVDEETGEVVEEGMAAGFDPGEEQLAEEREAMLGSFWDRARFRLMDVVFFQTWVLLTWGVWRVAGMMALGMALYKWGVLSGERSDRFYARLAAVGFGVGLPVVAFGAWLTHGAGYDPVAWFAYTNHPNYVGSIIVGLGWTGLVMLACRRGWVAPLQRGLAAVGRTAFTNYIGQTVICSALFFGWGFGLFGELSRAELAPVVVAIWGFQIVVSVWWLGRFRFGPLEWAWRSLTYWRPQPMRRERPGAGV